MRDKSSLTVSKAGWNGNFFHHSFRCSRDFKPSLFLSVLCEHPPSSLWLEPDWPCGHWRQVEQQVWMEEDAACFLPVAQDPEDWKEAGPLQEQPGRWLPQHNDQVAPAEGTSHQANRLTLTHQRDAEMSHHSPSFFPQVSAHNRAKKKEVTSWKKRGVKAVLNKD